MVGCLRLLPFITKKMKYTMYAVCRLKQNTRRTKKTPQECIMNVSFLLHSPVDRRTVVVCARLYMCTAHTDSCHTRPTECRAFANLNSSIRFCLAAVAVADGRRSGAPFACPSCGLIGDLAGKFGNDNQTNAERTKYEAQSIQSQ